jgi:hypothetical protein
MDHKTLFAALKKLGFNHFEGLLFFNGLEFLFSTLQGGRGHIVSIEIIENLVDLEIDVRDYSTNEELYDEVESTCLISEKEIPCKIITNKSLEVKKLEFNGITKEIALAYFIELQDKIDKGIITGLTKLK